MKCSARQYNTVRSLSAYALISALSLVIAACQSGSSATNAGGSTGGSSGGGNYTLTSVNGTVSGALTTTTCSFGTCYSVNSTSDTLTVVGAIDPFVANVQVAVTASGTTTSSTYPVTSTGTFSFAITIADQTSTQIVITPEGASGATSGTGTGIVAYANSSIPPGPTVATVKDATGATITLGVPTAGVYTIAANNETSITITGTIASTDASSGSGPDFVNAIQMKAGSGSFSSTGCSFTGFGASIGWKCITSIDTTASQDQSTTYQFQTVNVFTTASTATSITIANKDTLLGQSGISASPSGSGWTSSTGGSGHTLMGATVVSYSVSKAVGGTITNGGLKEAVASTECNSGACFLYTGMPSSIVTLAP